MNAPHHIDEKTLLSRLQTGDVQAFTELYEQYYGKLYLHAYNRLRNREAAKDLIHDLFASLWAKRETVVIQEGLSSYLYTAVRNRVIDYASSQNIRSAYIKSFAEYLVQPSGSTDHRVREKQLAEQIEKEITGLPPQVRLVFELSRKQHFSHKEIAAQLNLSEQTVRSYIKSALKILRLKFGIIALVAAAGLLKIF